MPLLNWKVFESLPGSRKINFENLCRSLIRLHYGQYGKFSALKNQPGVEFHLRLLEECPVLGNKERWYGWQCKLHELTAAGNLKSAAKKDIEDSLRKSETYLPDLTDWILWTPYTLSRQDQIWFDSLQTHFAKYLWVLEDIETHLNGPGLILRQTYFGKLVLLPDELSQRHRESIQPISERWLQPVHQAVDAERIIRRMLGEPGAWNHMVSIGERLKNAVKIILENKETPIEKETLSTFVDACNTFAEMLIHFHEILADGDFNQIQHQLSERKTLLSKEVFAVLRKFRALNLSIALDATNALDDMRIAQNMLDEIEDFIGINLVAVLADAGGGKTQMSAQLTSPQDDRPAGILLHGRTLKKGQTLDNLSHYFLLNGTPLESMEKLLAALDAAARRASRRLPLVIDGLNEAEDPRDWKASLATLKEIAKRYPNVLIVCTLRTGERKRKKRLLQNNNTAKNRESFAVLALPDGIRKIESEGFGGDVDKAISKYFEFFKINADNAEIPVEFLQHPLNLRIFCEVTNPKRESEISIDYIPESFALLFEKYVENACDRISQLNNLEYRFNKDEVNTALYKLGIQLWESKKRSINETIFRNEVSDSNRSWDSSIVNLLSQEGILFRNPGIEPGEYKVTPVYDALGGYLIANALLTKYKPDLNFDWIRDPNTIESFSGENSHSLAVDIFKSLILLTPHRMFGRHLWKEIPDNLKNAALMYTIGIDAKYIDAETVKAIETLFVDKPKERNRLFSRLKTTRSIVDHPLNVTFLDSKLYEQPVFERDLSWTEWIRETRSERFNELLSIEHRWKQNLSERIQTDRLRLKWVMWLLTSTDHELRDVATRTIYWFGRGAPDQLYEETIEVLKINDPYVSERMVAASYGVAMACHVDLDNDKFVLNILPKYARQLFNSLFAKDAPFATTHITLRDFATRTVELAILYDKNLFLSEEIKRTFPPFIETHPIEWKESENANKEYIGPNSPFHMDFENYTIGRLVPGRGNYNYKHEEYQKVRAKMLWRTEQLGWSSEHFKDIDAEISRKQSYSRTSSNEKKTDRYGKKYSWIAYFEMAGFLNDQGVLDNWQDRTAYVDIDPSFPEQIEEGSIFTSDILGDPNMEMTEWIKNGPLPKLDPFLKIENLMGVQGTWIALDGFVTQEDESRGRKSFSFIRSFIISNKDFDSFMERLSEQDLGGNWLPEKPEINNLFSGEIPWSELFQNHNLYKFSFIVDEKIVKVTRTKKEYCLDGKKIFLDDLNSDTLDRWHLISVNGDGTELERRLIFPNFSDETGKLDISDEDLKRIETTEVQIEVDEKKHEYVNFDTLIPVSDYRWEGYHSVTANSGTARILAKEIIADLDLIGQPQTSDLFSKDRLKATFNISDHNEDFNNQQSIFFIREDLLEKYLEKHESSLVWIFWGEREYSSDHFPKINRSDQHYKGFNFIRSYNK
ncbi:MAG: hypothetical protein PF503_25130 [Desulfobacula sp.]|jgi:hypothetical protein|nr:hypothetical protein [Desulfobacula sp.]